MKSAPRVAFHVFKGWINTSDRTSQTKHLSRSAKNRSFLFPIFAQKKEQSESRNAVRLCKHKISMNRIILLITSFILMTMSTIQAQENDRTFAPSDKVTVEKVHFRNRFGITLAADLYKPKNAEGKLPAIAVSGPFGAVKEQSSGLYAQTLAERGFLAIAFDPSYTGESSGEPRYVASPDINTEDFSAAVDFLIAHPNVDAKRIGIIGICGFGGMGLNAAAMDTRIKATVASTMYDMSRVNANGYFDAEDSAEVRRNKREAMNAIRTRDAQNGTATPGTPGLPTSIKGDEPQFVKDYFDYYKTERAFHARAINSNGAWNPTMALSFINMPLLTYIHEIDNAVLLIHGENAHSRYFSEDAFKRLKGNNKELLIVPGANHTDLYDRKIPFDKLEAFFKSNLK